MTTKVANSPADLEKLNANIARIEALSQRLVAAIAQKRAPNPALEAPGADLYAKAMGAWWTEALQNPARLMEQQVSYWGQTLQHYIEAQKALAAGDLKAPEDPTPNDRRFSNPLWKTHPYFNFIKQQYLRNAQTIHQAVAGLEGLDARDKQRVEYFSRQILDLMAPTNFLPTNPDALEKGRGDRGRKPCSGA